MPTTLVLTFCGRPMCPPTPLADRGAPDRTEYLRHPSGMLVLTITKERVVGRYQVCVDLHVVLRDEYGRVLLGERCNTGWTDGQLGLLSGHLEDGESATAGAAREAEEEIGVLIQRG